jgi:REP element-mobilizing transposase RayT
MIKYYLLSTEHLENRLWFRDEEDYRVAMNHIAIQVAICQRVTVLAFILMSNHVHFLVKGEWNDVKAFIDSFKTRFSKYLRIKYGDKEFLRHNRVDIKEIPYEDEALEKAIAYIHMNCVAANICSSPNQYQWGTGDLFFNTKPSKGTPVKDISVRACHRMTHSKMNCLPDHWIFSDDGYILPESYIDVKTVEAIYHTPKRMIFFNTNSSKARKRLEACDDNLPAFRDHIILNALPDLCRTMFQKDRFSELSPEEQTECLRQLRFRFSSDVNQLARVCGLSYAQAAQRMDSV